MCPDVGAKLGFQSRSSAKAALCNGMKRQPPESLSASFDRLAVRLRCNVGGKHKLFI